MNSTSDQSEQATPAAAIGLLLGACLAFACLDATAKYLVQSGLEAPFVAWMRFFVHVVLVLVLFRAWSNSALFRYRSMPIQVMRGVLLFGSTFFNFIALRTLQLDQTVSIYFFAPMVITALAGPLLGEWAGWRRWMAIIVGFMGVLVITRPGLGTFGVGYLYALASMGCYCGYVILTRQVGTRETAESLIFYSALTPVLLMFPVVPIYAAMPDNALQWALLISLGFYGAFGHYLLILAYRQAPATSVAPYAYSQIVWMIALGYLVFAELPDMWTIVGAGIIVMSGLYVVHREHRLRLQRTYVPNAENDDLAKRL